MRQMSSSPRRSAKSTYELVVAPKHPDEIAPEVLFGPAPCSAEDRHPLLERLVEPAGTLTVFWRQVLHRSV